MKRVQCTDTLSNLLRCLALLLSCHLSFISLTPESTNSLLLLTDLVSMSCISSASLMDLRSRAASARRSFISISVVFAVIPRRYHEMGGGGTIDGWISWFKLTRDPTLPLPPVHVLYSADVFGLKGRQVCSSTNKGSTFQQPSNLSMKPDLPCLNFTCVRGNHMVFKFWNGCFFFSFFRI